MLHVKFSNDWFYIIHNATGRFWNHKYKTAKYAELVRQEIQESWQFDPREKHKDLEASFTDRPDQVIESDKL